MVEKATNARTFWHQTEQLGELTLVDTRSYNHSILTRVFSVADSETGPLPRHPSDDNLGTT